MPELMQQSQQDLDHQISQVVLDPIYQQTPTIPNEPIVDEKINCTGCGIKLQTDSKQ